MTLRRKLIDKLLTKEELVAVPQDWQKEYVKLAGDKIRNGKTIDQLVREYNLLLKDYYDKHSVRELRIRLKEDGIKVPTNAPKEELVEALVHEYQMVFEKNSKK